MPIHVQTHAYDGYKSLFVDKGLKTLLEGIWAHGCSTLNSCQENKPGIVWIQFVSPNDAKMFIQLAWQRGDADLKIHIEGYHDPKSDWEYQILPHLDEDGTCYMPLSVRFPVTDLPKLERIFQCASLTPIANMEQA
jgi:hypothetical protein